MTMDVHQHRNVTTAASSSPPSRYSPPVAAGVAQPVQTSLPAAVVALHQRPQKRSFDVAFLMAPDDLSKRRPRPLQAAQPVARSAFTKVSPDPPPSLSPASSPATPPPTDFAAYMHHGQLHHQQQLLSRHQPQQECSLSPPLPPVAAHFMSPFPLGFRSPFALMMPPRPQPTASVKDYQSPLQPPPPLPPHHTHNQQQQQLQQQQQQQQLNNTGGVSTSNSNSNVSTTVTSSSRNPMANYADSYGIAAAAAAQWWSYPGAMDNNIQNVHNVPSPNSIMVKIGGVVVCLVVVCTC